MKKFLFFDTETTGLAEDFNADPREFELWPNLVQLGWMLTDETGKRLKWYNEIIKPRTEAIDLWRGKPPKGFFTARFSPGWTIPPNMIHGISGKAAMESGLDIQTVLWAFREACAQADAAICHNVDFDLPVIRAAYYREGLTPPTGHLPFYCTQKQTTHVVKAKKARYGRGYGLYKWPSLAELHGFCGFGIVEDAHDALADVEATAKCFFHVQKRYPDAFETPYHAGRRTCVFCGCTEEDCSQCIEEQGYPCHWISDRVCSRCEHKTFNLLPNL